MLETVLIKSAIGGWAVTHDTEFLGYTQTREEAAVIAQDLVEWISGQGRKVRLLTPEDAG